MCLLLSAWSMAKMTVLTGMPSPCTGPGGCRSWTADSCYNTSLLLVMPQLCPGKTSVQLQCMRNTGRFWGWSPSWALGSAEYWKCHLKWGS
jgi:hypothetical protein